MFGLALTPVQVTPAPHLLLMLILMLRLTLRLILLLSCRRLLLRLTLNMCVQVSALVSRIDVDHDGSVDYVEFVSWIRGVKVRRVLLLLLLSFCRCAVCSCSVAAAAVLMLLLCAPVVALAATEPADQTQMERGVATRAALKIQAQVKREHEKGVRPPIASPGLGWTADFIAHPGNGTGWAAAPRAGSAYSGGDLAGMQLRASAALTLPAQFEAK